MRYTKYLKSLLLCFWVGLIAMPISLQAQEDMETMFLVSMNVQNAQAIPYVYTTRYDQKRVKIEYAFEDTINYLADFVYEEDPMHGPDCFIPEMKLVFKYYTYVVSIYCTSAIKYKNSAPYKASSTRMKNDLIFTPSVYDYLNRLKAEHFEGELASKGLIDKVISSEPLEEPDMDLSDFESVLDDDDNDDELDEDLQIDNDEDYKLMFDDDDSDIDDDLDDIDLLDDDLDDPEP